jgi:(R,R)-butanediol dehydrogenase / meso-butanediol dehydrogenase / diacetyl reductase
MQTSAVPAALMPAVRWHGRGDVRVDAVPVPGAPGRDGIRVEVAWCGICGSDLHEYLSGPLSIPMRPHPVTGRCAPIVLGHEVSGWISQAGSSVTGLAVGDLVVLNALLPCGRCAPCADGAVHLCRALGHIGMSADGGLARYITVPASMAVRVPDGVPADLAALAEPLSVALHAVRLGGSGDALPGAASRALVLGAGAIGLCVALVLRAHAFLAAHGAELRQLITARIPLRDTVSRGLEVLTGPERGQHVKILVKAGG